MSRGVRWLLGGSIILVALAGCGRGFLNYEQRAPWRKDAELACLNSGTVKEGAGVVRISPIDGPGMCGADFPLKVSALGESSAMGYGDQPVRPPGAIPGRSRPVVEPGWPIATDGTVAAIASTAAARSAAPAAGCGVDAGRGEAHSDAGVSDRVGARSLDRIGDAARSAQVVPATGCRDQTDFRILLPRHE